MDLRYNRSRSASPSDSKTRSGAIAERGERGGTQRMPARVSGVDLMPVLHLRLSEPPAEENPVPVTIAWEIDQAQTPILELDPQVVELALIRIDLAGKRLRP